MSDWIDGPPERDAQRNWPIGVLLELRASGEFKQCQVLVGHINELGGVCNDCPWDIRPEEILRHRVLWTEGGA